MIEITLYFNKLRAAQIGQVLSTIMESPCSQKMKFLKLGGNSFDAQSGE